MKQGSLRIEAAEETDQGKYECVATNTVGTEYSYSAQLYVRVRRVPPHFTIKPEDKYDVKRRQPQHHLCGGGKSDAFCQVASRSERPNSRRCSAHRQERAYVDEHPKDKHLHLRCRF